MNNEAMNRLLAIFRNVQRYRVYVYGGYVLSNIEYEIDSPVYVIVEGLDPDR